MIKKFERSRSSQKYENKMQINSSECFDMTLADMDIGIYTKLHNKIIKQFADSTLSTLNKQNGMSDKSYLQLSNEAKQAIVKWYNQQYDCSLKLGLSQQTDKNSSQQKCNSAYINFIPSVVTIISYSILAFTKPDDKILIFTPVYSSYITIISSLKRKVVALQLDYVKGQSITNQMTLPINSNKIIKNNNIKNLSNFYIDFAKLQILMQQKDIKMMIISHPHNPSGRVWNINQVKNIVKLSKKYNITIISDQILSDLYFSSSSQLKFYSFAKQFSEYSKIMVTNSISKSFNYSSIQGGYTLIGDLTTNKQFINIAMQNFNDKIDSLGLSAVVGCLSKQGKQWLLIIRQILQKNFMKLKLFKQWIAPKLQISNLEAAYLVYIDFSAYFKNSEDLKQKLNQNNIWVLDLSNNYFPTKKGSLQMRICIACQQTHFNNFLKTLQKVIKEQQFNSNIFPKL